MSKPKQIRILAIETSADETSAAVLVGNTRTKKFKLSSNIVYSQIAVHRKTGGIVPEVAARAHIPKVIPAIKLALQKARANLDSIDCLAVTAGPGLITSLMIGVDTAKALAFALGKPIIPINHMEGHLFSALGNNSSYPPLTLRGGTLSAPSLKLREGGGELLLPALGLTVSGGHTMLVLIKDTGKYKILGQTLDDAAGECFDKVAKILGLSYPGGPAISKLAEKGNPRAFDFPRPMIKQKNYHFSFAGLKTAVLYFLRDHPHPQPLSPRGRGRKGEGEKFKANIAASPSPLLAPLRGRGIKGEGVVRADVAASVEQSIVDVLVAKTIRAAKAYKVKTILLGGGVSANKKLRQELARTIKKQLPATNYYLPAASLTTDNAGMIALAAFYHYIYGDTATFAKVKANPNWTLKSWR